MSHGRQKRKNWLVCTLGLFVLWKSVQQPHSGSSFVQETLGKQNFKQTQMLTERERQTSNRPWARALAQTDKMHKLTSRDRCACKRGQTWAHMHTLLINKTLFFLSKASLSPVPCVCSVCIWLPWDRRWGQLNSLPCITSCHLFFSAEPRQPAGNLNERCQQPAFSEDSACARATLLNIHMRISAVLGVIWCKVKQKLFKTVSWSSSEFRVYNLWRKKIMSCQQIFASNSP